MGEPWSLPQGRTAALRGLELFDLFGDGGLPCYGCGLFDAPDNLVLVWMCNCCARVLCADCWDGGMHARDRCFIPAATAEGQAAEWAAEVAAGRVRPDGVIATGVVPDLGGER